MHSYLTKSTHWLEKYLLWEGLPSLVILIHLLSLNPGLIFSSDPTLACFSNSSIQLLLNSRFASCISSLVFLSPALESISILNKKQDKHGM